MRPPFSRVPSVSATYNATSSLPRTSLHHQLLDTCCILGEPYKSKMPSLDARLAWALEVDVYVFGAHLEAYVNLRPTLRTLRLCNRHGGSGGITRLPAELITEIESYLMDAEREKARAEWSAASICWKGSCDAVDHFSAAEQIDMYNERGCHASDGDSNLCEFGSGSGADEVHVSQPLDDVQIEQLNDHLQSRCEGCFGVWMDEHEARRRSWSKRVGHPAGGKGGLARSEDLLKDFGLDSWVAHSPVEDREARMWDDEEVSYYTTVHLMLPALGSVSRSWDASHNQYDGHREPVEVSHALTVAQSQTPPKRSLRRFPRALKILGVRPKPQKQGIDLAADNGDVTDDDEEDEEDGEKGKGKSAGWPGLMLLLVNKDDT